MREHRLYQSDWMMRFYGYAAGEEVAAAADPATGMLPLDIDPKLAWALRFRESFPVDVNRAPREALLRVPGLGVKAVDRHRDRAANGGGCGSRTSRGCRALSPSCGRS